MVSKSITVRQETYSEEPSGTYAGDTSPREDHGHIHRARTDCTPNEEEQQRQLEPEMASIDVGDGGEEREEDCGGEKVRGTNVAGRSK